MSACTPEDFAVSDLDSSQAENPTKKPVPDVKNKSRRQKAPVIPQPDPLLELAQRPVKLLSAPEIMLHLHNEHKYMTKLLNVLNEQLVMVNVGQIPDFGMMYEVAHYLSTFSDATHHPHEDVIYKKLALRDSSIKGEVENLLIEHESTSKKTESLLGSLRKAVENPSFEAAERLRFRCEDYIETLNNHMDLEESLVFPRIREVLTEEDWTDIINEIQPGNDPLFGKTVEKRYEELFDAISSEVERATEEFTLAEFIGLNATMENIGVIATYSNRIGGIVNQRFRQAYRGNGVAFRKLRRASTSKPSDYISVTVDCFLNNFDTYTDTLRDIGRVLRKARTQIAEPYSSRLRIYHDTSRVAGTHDQEHH